VRRRNASLRRPHAADRFITERAVIVRILDHLGEPGRAPRMAPIRGPPDDGNMTRQDDLWTGRSRHPDRPVDVMPDYEKQNQDLVRQAQTLRTRTDFKAASMTASVHEMARAPGRHPQAGLARVQSAPRGSSAPEHRSRGRRDAQMAWAGCVHYAARCAKSGFGLPILFLCASADAALGNRR
jgi:hypothetical protein